FLGSCAIFGSLSLAALYAERRSMLFWEVCQQHFITHQQRAWDKVFWFLISGLNMLVMMLFFIIFLGLYMVFQEKKRKN
ncbi:hypothetical protein GBAR_LOCUS4791, partial [Geodia barretti]